MLFRSGKNWAVELFLRRGWLIKRPQRVRRRPSSWNPLSTVPAECLEERVQLSTITVTSAADSGAGTLRNAIASASAGDTINFASAINGTPIVLTSGELTISRSLTITGNGAANTIIDAAKNSRIFSISSGVVTFDSLTLENGKTTDVGTALGGTGDGGAIRSLSTGVLTIQNSTLSGNSTSGNQAKGGAIYDVSGTVAVTNSTLTGNYTVQMKAYGGAIDDQSGAVTITSSTLSGNFTQGQSAMGGAIFSPADTVTVTNSTLTGNSATGSFSYAGAIGTYSGSITAINSTIVQNNATVGGGIATFLSTAAITLTNTILAQNTDNGTAPDLYQRASTTVTLTNSLIGTNTGNNLTAAPVGMPDLRGNLIGNPGALIDPRLGPLNFNGGLTSTMALLANSPAIDAGTNSDPTVALLLSDQRGTPFFRRFGTAVDIGAYEFQTQALSLVVTSTDDTLDAGYDPAHLTLRDAVALADGNVGPDAITFDPSLNGTPIVVTESQMVITETVTITGNGAANTIIDAAHNSRIFSITSTAGDVTLDSLTLENGQTTASFTSGGAIRDDSTGTLSILNSIVSGNSTTGDHATGGAISDNSGTIAISNSTFSGNSTSGYYGYGGAIGSQFGHLTIIDSTLSGNHTTGVQAGGGAIAAAYLTVTDSTLTANYTHDDYARGGAIAALHDVTITNSSLTGNSTAGHAATGGAIDSIFGTVTVTRSNLSGNFTTGTSGDGGAIYDEYGSVALHESTLAGNYTKAQSARGGAILSGGTSVTVTNSTLSGNSTAGANAIGGAIAAHGEVIVTNSTLSGNSTAGLLAVGGAIYSYKGAVTVINSTIAENHATNAEGGGIYSFDSAATVTLTNSILAQNTDNGTAPDLDIDPAATLVVAFSLIGDNTGTTGLSPAPVGTPDGNGNLIGTTGAVIDPLLGALAFNGGPTKTMALLAGSPALDAGNNAEAVDPSTSAPLTTDQRGAPFARIAGAAVDMGAYEVQSLAMPTVDFLATNHSLPVVTGTYDQLNTEVLQVILNGTTFTLGTSPQLTSNGSGHWTLATTAAIPDGTYDVVVHSTDPSGDVATDATTVDLIVNTVAPASTMFAGEYAVATAGSNVLSLASITQTGTQLTLNGATTASATVTSTTQLQIGSVIATYGDSQITFGSTGTFANQTWTKLDLPANYTNSRGAATHITQNGASLMFVDSVGGTSPGQWISPTQVFATAWNESATTDIGRLLWQDGSIWSENLVLQGTKNGAGTTTITASPSQFTVVDYTNGSGKPVHLIKTGTTHVVFVDSLGRMSLGSFFNPTQALADLYPGDVATFSGGGVLWKDGTVWIQAASLSPQITLTDYTNANGVATHLIRNGTANLAIGDSLGRLSLGTFFNATQALTNLYPHDVATITPNTITWQDGTVWTVTGSSPITTTATDANGVLSHLKLLTPTMLIGLDGPLQGVHGTRLNGKLFWANGAVWDNLDLSALNAFFEMGTGYP